MASYVLMCR